jgi:hypothetical protein
MCDAEGTTKEHVPPFSFFPEGFRENLITVHSCFDHNTKNSKDVEYVRNVIVTHIDTNEVARLHFKNKAMRSFARSPKLFTQTFGDATPIVFNDQEMGIYTCDLLRFKSVMRAVAYAIYFKSFVRTYPGDWGIFSPSMVSPKSILEGEPDSLDTIRQLLSQLSPTELPLPQPEVFKCGIKQWDRERLVYEFLFYEGFVVHAIAMPPSSDVSATL